MGNLEQKNTVSSKNQVNSHVFFEGEENGNVRIMFVGNSITWHQPAPGIGWYGNWGMAASAKENDYVHLCMKYIKEKYSNAYFCIVQASEWERGYNECNIEGIYAEAGRFNPDVIITRLSENIPADYLEKNSLVCAMEKFHKFLSGKGNPKIIVTSNLFNNKIKDVPLREYAEKLGAEYVYMNDYMEDKENFANEYEHEGVRIHPGDKGMKFIADRIISALAKITD